LYATEGARRLLTRGLAATCARNSTFNGIYFGLIFSAQQKLPRRASAAADAAQNLALGGVAGALTCFPKAPFDVIKSRIQAELPASTAGGVARYAVYSGGVVQGLRHVASTEGVRALWKGMVPMMARMFIGMGVSFAAFDAALAALGREGGAREAAAATDALLSDH
jgi:Mitochondrial carrier protein